MTKLIIVFLLSAFVYVNGRHIHPHGDTHGKPEVEEVWMNKQPAKQDYTDVEVLEVPRNIKPNRFVPLNNALFFMGPQPCAEEGFKRDYMGICREVWD